MLIEQFSYKTTVAPGNSAIWILWDSTRLGRMSTAAVAAGSAFLIPSTDVGFWGNVIINGKVTPTGQAVTIVFYKRAEFDNDANDWVQDTNAPGGGSIAVAAAATQPFSWLTGDGDHLIRVNANATGPTTLVCTVTVVPTTDYGT